MSHTKEWAVQYRGHTLGYVKAKTEKGALTKANELYQGGTHGPLTVGEV